MRVVIIFVFALFVGRAYGQERSIHYVFPKKVQHLLEGYIKDKLSENPSQSYYCVIYSDEQKQTFKLAVQSYAEADDTAFKDAVKASNRVVLIDSYILPVMFELDYTFISYGERNGRHIRKHLIYEHPYWIRFDKSGEILKCGSELEN